MPKTTQINTAKAEKRKAAIELLKARGPVSSENSIKVLRERIALIEDILGLRSK